MSASSLDGFHHASLSVGDLERSTAWYERIFDLVPLFQERGDARRAVVYRLPGTSSMLGLVEHVDGDASAFRADRVGLDHLAFSVPTRRAIEGWAEHLAAQGIEHSGVIEIPTGAILNFRDPDGIQLAIFWEDDGPA